MPDWPPFFGCPELPVLLFATRPLLIVLLLSSAAIASASDNLTRLSSGEDSTGSASTGSASIGVDSAGVDSAGMDSVDSASTDTASVNPPVREWELGLGGTAVHIPHYIGADDARDYALPFPYFVYHGKRWNIDRNFLYRKLLERGNLKIDLSLSGTPPVDSAENSARQGMPDLDATGEIGPQVQYTLSETDGTLWRADLALRKVVSTDFSSLGDAGYTLSPQLYISQRWHNDGARWQLESTLGPVYGSDQFHDFFYEVAPQYATAERPAYDPKAGFGGWRWAAGLTRREGNFWFGAFVRYYDLSDAEFLDSPLVRREQSLLAGFAVAWILQSGKTP